MTLGTNSQTDRGAGHQWYGRRLLHGSGVGNCDQPTSSEGRELSAGAGSKSRPVVPSRRASPTTATGVSNSSRVQRHSRIGATKPTGTASGIRRASQQGLDECAGPRPGVSKFWWARRHSRRSGIWRYGAATTDGTDGTIWNHSRMPVLVATELERSQGLYGSAAASSGARRRQLRHGPMRPDTNSAELREPRGGRLQSISDGGPRAWPRSSMSSSISCGQ